MQGDGLLKVLTTEKASGRTQDKFIEVPIVKLDSVDIGTVHILPKEHAMGILVLTPRQKEIHRHEAHAWLLPRCTMYTYRTDGSKRQRLVIRVECRITKILIASVLPFAALPRNNRKECALQSQSKA